MSDIWIPVSPGIYSRKIQSPWIPVCSSWSGSLCGIEINKASARETEVPSTSVSLRLQNAKVKIFWHFWFCLEFGGWYSVNITHLVTGHASHIFPCPSLSTQRYNSTALVELFPRIRTGCAYQMCDVGSQTENRAGGWLPGLLFLALLETGSHKKLWVTSSPESSHQSPHAPPLATHSFTDH